MVAAEESCAPLGKDGLVHKEEGRARQTEVRVAGDLREHADVLNACGLPLAVG